jgi:hypothetical protein
MVGEMAENRIDPTVAGLFLVAFIALVFGFLGFQIFLGFGFETVGEEIITVFDVDWGLDAVAAPLAAAIGIVFLVLTVSAIRVGNAFAAALFAFVAIALTAVQYGFEVSSFMFYILAIVFIVFALVAFIVGAPKMLAIMLIFVGLLYMFVGVFSIDGFAGESAETFGLLFGIFGILAGLVAMYLAFALSTQKLQIF